MVNIPHQSYKKKPSFLKYFLQQTAKKLFFYLTIFISSIFFAYAIPPVQIPLQIGTLETRDHVVLRTGFWPKSTTVSGRGTIVILEGMGGFLEFYQEAADILSAMGFDVYSFDWRGQGGSTRFTKTPSLLHVENFQFYLNDLSDFMNEKIKRTTKNPVFLLGVSLGGHLALRYAHDHSEELDGLILLAPMIKINTSPYPFSVAQSLASCCVAVGQGERFALGFHPHDFKGCANKFDEKKHGDMSRYLDRCLKLSQNQHLAIGGPSFSWIAAAFDSCNQLCQNAYIQKINLPILMIISNHDHLVDKQAQRQICDSLQRCQGHFYEKGHHNILMDSDDVRDRFWNDFKNFMMTISEGSKHMQAAQ